MGAAGAPGAARRAAGAGRAAGTTSDAAAASAVGRIRARRFRRVTLAARRGDIMPKRKVTPGPASPRPRPPRPRHGAACCGPPASPRGRRPRSARLGSPGAVSPPAEGEDAEGGERGGGRNSRPGRGRRRGAAGGVSRCQLREAGGEPRSERAAPFAPPHVRAHRGAVPARPGSPGRPRSRLHAPGAGGRRRFPGERPGASPPPPPLPLWGPRRGSRTARRAPGGTAALGFSSTAPPRGGGSAVRVVDNCGPACRVGQPESFVADRGPRIALRPVSTPLNKATG